MAAAAQQGQHNVDVDGAAGGNDDDDQDGVTGDKVDNNDGDGAMDDDINNNCNGTMGNNDE